MSPSDYAGDVLLSSVFQCTNLFNFLYRVSNMDWGADFRKLSAGAALVGLTLWLDSMQVIRNLLSIYVYLHI